MKNFRRYQVLQLQALEIFTLSSDKSDRKRQIGKKNLKYSLLVHLPPAFQDSENWILETFFPN